MTDDTPTEEEKAPASEPPQESPPRVEVRNDDLEAHIVLMGPRHHRILYEDLIDLLDSKGVIFGVDVTGIRRQVSEYNDTMHEKPSRDFLVARGQPPQPGQDGKVEILIKPPPPVTFDEHGRADYRNIQRFRTVEKGQVLAVRTPPVEGKAGINVFGEEIPARKPDDAKLEHGPNVQFVSSANEYRSLVHGIFVHERHRIDVNPELIINGHVGLESGNITYDGNVRISHNVERAALVSATGDVEVGGTVESGNVRVGGSLTVKNGLNTKREGMLNVNGDLFATYIDNSVLTVFGSVIVHKSALNSKIICYGDLTLSGRGSALTGGEATVFGSLSADNIGSKLGVPTKIYMGQHDRNMQYYKIHIKEMEEIERDYEKLRDDVLKIKNYVQRMRGKIPVDKQAQFRTVYKKYKHQVELRERIHGQVAEFRESRYNHEPVRVVVRDTIYPGVELHYKQHTEKITVAQTRVVFVFHPGVANPSMEAYRPQK